MEVFRENNQGELMVKKGKMWRIFDYGITVWTDKEVRTRIEVLLRNKGYHSGDHEARGLLLKEALDWAVPLIQEGKFLLPVTARNEGAGGRFLDFTTDKTDYARLAEVYRAFPMFRREFVMNQILKMALEKGIGEKVDERTG